MKILDSIYELHKRQVEFEYPAIRLNKSIIFMSSASGVLEKLVESNFGLLELCEVSV
jgi:hypothetical protein